MPWARVGGISTTQLLLLLIKTEECVSESSRADKHLLAIVRLEKTIRLTISTPVSATYSTIEKPNPIDLEPRKSRLINSLARPIAVRHVINHRTVMADWPRRPLKLYHPTSFDRSGSLCIGRRFVADDVCIAEGAWCDKAIVEIEGNRPANNDGSWCGVLIRRIVSLVAEKMLD